MGDAGSLVDARWARAALGLAALAGLLTALATSFERFPLDAPLTERVNDLGGWYGPLAGLTNEFGGLLAIGGVAAGALLAWRRARPDLALLLPIALLLRWPLTSLKSVADRPRPDELLVVRDLVHDSSFPSGHVMTAAVAAGMWFVLAPGLVPPRWVLPARAVALAFVTLSGLGRMWAGVHWLSDVYGGVVWAMALVAAVLALRPLLQRALGRPASA